MKALLYKIKCLRQEMYAIVLAKGRLQADVLIASQKLDKVLNEIYKLDLSKESK
jgi:hypothetical protein